MTVYFDDSGEDIIPESLYEIINKLTNKCLKRHNKNEMAELSCSFVSVNEIRQLNKDYRGMDSETDVLSFPVPFAHSFTLGDIVICTSVAKAQAEKYGHSFEREIAFLFVHGLLHLLGYDHKDEPGEKIMRGEQRAVLHEDEE